ncbi:hypothetical protein HGRIS_010805 [Hohenbuehelia grisea]|uniref:C2H2-type domain-containing protein n=1 Tax=Hohenbuehelia grisea TaxID=104357 RepID=A0ABR3IY70_9AGAR
MRVDQQQQRTHSLHCSKGSYKYYSALTYPSALLASLNTFVQRACTPTPPNWHYLAIFTMIDYTDTVLRSKGCDQQGVKALWVTFDRNEWPFELHVVGCSPFRFCIQGTSYICETCLSHGKCPPLRSELAAIRHVINTALHNPVTYPCPQAGCSFRSLRIGGLNTHLKKLHKIPKMQIDLMRIPSQRLFSTRAVQPHWTGPCASQMPVASPKLPSNDDTIKFQAVPPLSASTWAPFQSPRPQDILRAYEIYQMLFPELLAGNCGSWDVPSSAEPPVEPLLPDHVLFDWINEDAVAH